MYLWETVVDEEDEASASERCSWIVIVRVLPELAMAERGVIMAGAQ